MSDYNEFWMDTNILAKPTMVADNMCLVVVLAITDSWLLHFPTHRWLGIKPWNQNGKRNGGAIIR